MSATLTWSLIADKLTDGHSERRRCIRVPWVTPITVSVAGGDGRGPRTDKTSTIDFSMNGISFAWRHPIEPGTAISVRFDYLSRQPELTGVVRHFTHVDGRPYYRVRAEFIDPYEDARR